MKARVREWMKAGLVVLGGMVLLLGYLWVGGVLLDRGQEVDDPDIAAYVPARESSPGARALLDMSSRVDRGRYSDGDPTYGLERDVGLLRLYANTIDRDEIDEEDEVLDRFEADDTFRRGWVAGLLASNQFVFAALDRAAADTDFRFVDSTWQGGLPVAGFLDAWKGPVLAQLHFDAESGDTAAMTAHFARDLRVLGRLREGGGIMPVIVSTECQAIAVCGMSELVDEYDFGAEDLARLDQILASAPGVQEAELHRARIRSYVCVREDLELLLDGSRSLKVWRRKNSDFWPDWLLRLGFRYVLTPRNMLDWMARQIAADKAAGFDLEALERLEQARTKMMEARAWQWWRPGFFMYKVYPRTSKWVGRILEQREDVQALRKKIADRIELKRRGGTPVLKKHVFGRPADEESPGA